MSRLPGWRPFAVRLISCLFAAGAAADLYAAEAPDKPPVVPVAYSTFKAKIHPTLVHRLLAEGEAGPVKAWVLFTDKGEATASPIAYRAAIEHLAKAYDRRAVERRRRHRTRPGLFDVDDLPVVPEYVEQVRATGATVHVVSRWVNGVSVLATRDEFDRISTLPFVQKLQPVRRGRTDPLRDVHPIQPRSDGDEANRSAAGTFYGESEAQLAQIDVIAVHDLGYTAEGVVVGILDTGFERSHVAFNDPTHPLDVIAEWDFVDDDPYTGIEAGDPANQHTHGTLILGTLGAYRPGEYVGGAYDASFILCKTEDTTAEYPAEEDNYVAGLEFIESNGGDLVTSSLGYVAWYDQADLDGLTAVTTVAVNVATANGLICLNAAGNSGHDSDPSTSHLIAPADALEVFAVGAVGLGGGIASFSSDGPSADGRVKPEVLACGSSTASVSPSSTTGYTAASGTSLSTPLAAGAVACLVQAFDDWTVPQMRNIVLHSAGYYVSNQTFDPLYIRGYGVINALRALEFVDCNLNTIADSTEIANQPELDCDGNGVLDSCELADGTAMDCDLNALPDVCDIADGTLTDGDGDGYPDECPYAAQLAAWPAGERKNRYISFLPADNSFAVGYEVTLVSSEIFPESTGVLGWVGEPRDPSCQNIDTGAPLPGNPECQGVDAVSRVSSSPYYSASWPSLVHVGDCRIVPRATYEMQAVTDAPVRVSAALSIDTAAKPGILPWADSVGSFTGSWSGPNGVVNFDDVTAQIRCFLKLPDAPHMTWADIARETPNYVCNFTDVQQTILAFKGFDYGYPAPSDCP